MGVVIFGPNPILLIFTSMAMKIMYWHDRRDEERRVKKYYRGDVDIQGSVDYFFKFPFVSRLSNQLLTGGCFNTTNRAQ